MVYLRLFGFALLIGLNLQSWANSTNKSECNVEYLFETHMQDLFRCLESEDYAGCLGDYVLLPPDDHKKTVSNFYEPTLKHQNRKDRRFIIREQAGRLKANFTVFLSQTTKPWYDIFYPERTVEFENIERYNLNHYKVYIRNHKNPGRPGFVEMMRLPEFTTNNKSDYGWYPHTEICVDRQAGKRAKTKTAWRILDLDGLLTAL